MDFWASARAAVTKNKPFLSNKIWEFNNCKERSNLRSSDESDWNVFHLFISEFQQSCHGVGARWEDEDERSAAVAVCKRLSKVKWRNLHKLLSQTAGHELLHHRDDLKSNKQGLKGFSF